MWTRMILQHCDDATVESDAEHDRTAWCMGIAGRERLKGREGARPERSLARWEGQTRRPILHGCNQMVITSREVRW